MRGLTEAKWQCQQSLGVSAITFCHALPLLDASVLQFGLSVLSPAILRSSLIVVLYLKESDLSHLQFRINWNQYITCYDCLINLPSWNWPLTLACILGSKILKLECEKWQKARILWRSSLGIEYLKISVHTISMSMSEKLF